MSNPLYPFGNDDDLDDLEAAIRDAEWMDDTDKMFENDNNEDDEEE